MTPADFELTPNQLFTICFRDFVIDFKYPFFVVDSVSNFLFKFSFEVLSLTFYLSLELRF